MGNCQAIAVELDNQLATHLLCALERRAILLYWNKESSSASLCTHMPHGILCNDAFRFPTHRQSEEIPRFVQAAQCPMLCILDICVGASQVRYVRDRSARVALHNSSIKDLRVKLGKVYPNYVHNYNAGIKHLFRLGVR